MMIMFVHTKATNFTTAKVTTAEKDAQNRENFVL